MDDWLKVITSVPFAIQEAWAVSYELRGLQIDFSVPVTTPKKGQILVNFWALSNF